MESQRTILVFNSGSSSLKFGVYQVDAGAATAVLHGEAEAIGKPGRLRVQDSAGVEIEAATVEFSTAAAAVAGVRDLVMRHAQAAPDVVGHRLVHGGPGLLAHAVIDARVMAGLREAVAFAPLHMPAALAVVESAQALFPGCVQVACLDTAFHADLPEIARVLPLPQTLREAGLRRYGFHGLSCESILARLDPVPRRLIIAHLGSGASITAIKAGRSVDTSMGLTPAGGVIMGSRCGDLDPGALIWIGRRQGLDYDALEEVVNRRSGLLGISGLTGDMRRLRAAKDHPHAQLALRMFAVSVAKQVAAMMVSLDGLDLLVFTGGIGEHDGAAREEICAALGWTGIRLAPAGNPTGAGLLSSPDSAFGVQVVPTAEEAQIARHAWRLATRA